MTDGLQQEVRVAISHADDLARRAHEARIDALAGRLDALRTVLTRVDEGVGARDHAAPWLDLVVETRRILEELSTSDVILAPSLRLALDLLLASTRVLPSEIERFATWVKSAGIAVRPLFGALPLRRLVPPTAVEEAASPVEPDRRDRQR